MTIWSKLLDRTAVLFLGVAVGAAMGYAFGSAGNGDGDVADVPAPRQSATAVPHGGPGPAQAGAAQAALCSRAPGRCGLSRAGYGR